MTPAPKMPVAMMITHFWTLNFSTITASAIPATMPISQTMKFMFMPIAISRPTATE